MKKRYILGFSIEIFSIIVFKSLSSNIVIKDLSFGARWLIVSSLVIPFLFIIGMVRKDHDVKENTKKIADILFWSILLSFGIFFLVSFVIVLTGGTI